MRTLTPAAPSPAGPEEAIERASRRFRRQRLAVALRELAGLDARPAREELRAAADRLADLRYRHLSGPRERGLPPAG